MAWLPVHGLCRYSSHKEPNGLSRSDGKRSMAFFWCLGKPLTWNVTIVCPLAASYVATAARVAGSADEGAAARKSAEYTDIKTNYMFQPIAVESLGLINGSECAFLSKLGHKLSAQSGDDREISFLCQRLSVSFSVSMRFYFCPLHSFVKE